MASSFLISAFITSSGEEHRISRVPSTESTPDDLDALLAHVAGRVAALRDTPVSAAALEPERQLLGDVSRAAVALRHGADACRAALSGDLEATAAALDRGAGHAGTDAADARDGRGIDPLTRFAILRGTDKWGPHFYTPVYHELFSGLRALPIRLLEIGIGGHDSPRLGGASLLMWADYFPHAHIVGLDVVEKHVEPHPRISVVRGSQDDAAFLEAVVAEHGPFDVVVDDGSHRPDHVAASFDVLFPALADNGIYVIEDVHTAFWPRFGGSPDGAQTMALAHAALRGLNHTEIAVADPGVTPPAAAATLRSFRAYHNLLVFQKGDNREPSTQRYDADNAHVQRAIALMERELAAAPTPDGLAQLARTCSLARLDDRAQQAVRRGLAAWPDHLALLVAGFKAARRAGDAALFREYAARLEATAGGDPYVRDLVAKASKT
jgi:hypothetical protein